MQIAGAAAFGDTDGTCAVPISRTYGGGGLLTWAASAAADPLKGQYAFTESSVRLYAPGSSGTAFNPTPGIALPNSGFHTNLAPIDGNIFSTSLSVEGTGTFNGDGTGTAQGTEVGTTVPPTPSQGYPSFPRMPRPPPPHIPSPIRSIVMEAGPPTWCRAPSRRASRKA